jgi:hypothetical protein
VDVWALRFQLQPLDCSRVSAWTTVDG